MLTRRQILTIMLFFGFFVAYSLRVIISLTIVAMTSPISSENGTEIEPEFDWNSKQQGYVLSSFFYGYIITQFPGGILARKISAHLLLGTGIALSSTMTLLAPIAAKTGLGALIFTRVLAGMFEGIIFPCEQAIMVKWVPPAERSRVHSFAFAGCFVGTVFALAVAGFISYKFGWEIVFYTFGSIALVWYALWMTIMTESPEKDRFITEEEKKFIMESIAEPPTTSSKIPWKDIFTSMPVTALIISSFASNWTFYTFFTQIPSYLEDAFRFSLERTGFISALPHLVLGILIFFAGFLADCLLVKDVLSKQQIRKIFISGSLIIQMIFLLLIANTTSISSSLLYLILEVSLGAFCMVAYIVNPLDIAPQFASIITSLYNSFCTFAGILSPILTGFIVTDRTVDEWRIVFFISAGISFFGAVFYWIFGKAEILSWAKIDIENTSKTFEANELYSNK